MIKKILVISDASWDVNNNIGNTFSNIFSSFSDYIFHSIYAKDSKPNNDVCNSFLQISEVQMIKKIFRKKTVISRILRKNTNQSDEFKNIIKKGQWLYSIFKKVRFQLFLLMRECLWAMNKNLISKNVSSYIEEVKPDLIFYTPSTNIYMNRIFDLVVTLTQKPSIIYFLDDVFETSKKRNFDLFGFYRKAIRKQLTNTSKRASQIYTIIEKQKIDYENIYQIKSEVLNKFYSPKVLPVVRTNNQQVVITYAGNLYAGRFKTLLHFCRFISLLNARSLKYIVNIYSADKLSLREIRKANKMKGITFKGFVDKLQIEEILFKSDFLLHVESFERKHIASVEYSLSTKVVDYLFAQKPILAIGDIKCASIDYLNHHQAAITFTHKAIDLNDLNDKLNDDSLHKRVCDNSLRLALTNHNYNITLDRLKLEMERLINDGK